MICKVCKQPLTDEAHTIHVQLGRLSFDVHDSCKGALTEGANAVGAAVRTVVNLRKPGFFENPLVRACGAALRELSGARK